MCRQIITLHVQCTHTTIKQEQCEQATSPFSTFFCDDFVVDHLSCNISRCCGSSCKNDVQEKWHTIAKQLLSNIQEMEPRLAQEERDFTLCLRSIARGGPLQQQRGMEAYSRFQTTLPHLRKGMETLRSRLLMAQQQYMVIAKSGTRSPEVRWIMPQGLDVASQPTNVATVTQGFQQALAEAYRGYQPQPSSRSLEHTPRNIIQSLGSPFRSSLDNTSRAAAVKNMLFQAQQSASSRPDTSASKQHFKASELGSSDPNEYENTQTARSGGRGRSRGSSRGKGSGRGGRRRKAKSPDGQDRGSSPIRRSGRLSTKRKVIYAESSDEEIESPSRDASSIVSNYNQASDNTSAITRNARGSKRRRTEGDGDSDFGSFDGVHSHRTDYDSDENRNEVEDKIVSTQTTNRPSASTQSGDGQEQQHHVTNENAKQAGHELLQLLENPKVRELVKLVQQHGDRLQLPTITPPPGPNQARIHPSWTNSLSNPLGMTFNDGPVPGIRPPLPPPEPHAFARVKSTEYQQPSVHTQGNTSIPQTAWHHDKTAIGNVASTAWQQHIPEHGSGNGQDALQSLTGVHLPPYDGGLGMSATAGMYAPHVYMASMQPDLTQTAQYTPSDSSQFGLDGFVDQEMDGDLAFENNQHGSGFGYGD